MEDLSIPKKPTISFTLVAVLFNVVIACIAMLGMKSIINSLNSLYQGPYQTVTVSGDLNKSLNAQQKYLLMYLTNDDQDSIIEYRLEPRRLDLVMQSDIAILRNNLTLQENRDKLNLLIADSATLKRLSEQLQNMYGRGEVESIKKLYYSDFVTIVNASQALSFTFSPSPRSVANQFYTSASKTEKQMYQIAAVFSAAIPVFIILICIYIICIITKPIKQIKSVMFRFSEGELDVDILYVSKGEPGVLVEGMCTASGNLKAYIDNISYMPGAISRGDITITVDVDYKNDFTPIRGALVSIMDSLNNILSQVQVAVSQISTGVEQVSLGAQTLPRGITEQTSSTEEFAVIISEISGGVKANPSNAQTASPHADETAHVTQDGDTLMQQFVGSISGMEKTSTEISKIIKTINDVAFQTNILTLSAAAEAARVGPVGRGFFVVVGEVRSLASKSTQAADNTTLPVEDTLSAIQNSTTLIDKVCKSLDTIAKRSSDVTVPIQDIAVPSQEQTGAIDQANEGINLIPGTVQINSATAEESTAASEELSGQFEIMLSLASMFQLREGATAGPVQISDLPEDPRYSDFPLFSSEPDLFSEEKFAEFVPLL